MYFRGILMFYELKRVVYFLLMIICTFHLIINSVSSRSIYGSPDGEVSVSLPTMLSYKKLHTDSIPSKGFFTYLTHVADMVRSWMNISDDDVRMYFETYSPIEEVQKSRLPDEIKKSYIKAHTHTTNTEYSIWSSFGVDMQNKFKEFYETGLQEEINKKDMNYASGNKLTKLASETERVRKPLEPKKYEPLIIPNKLSYYDKPRHS